MAGGSTFSFQVAPGSTLPRSSGHLWGQALAPGEATAPWLYEPPMMHKPLGCLPSCSTLRRQRLPGTRTGMFNRQDMAHTEQSRVWSPLPLSQWRRSPQQLQPKCLVATILDTSLPTPYIPSPSRWPSSSTCKQPLRRRMPHLHPKTSFPLGSLVTPRASLFHSHHSITPCSDLQGQPALLAPPEPLRAPSLPSCPPGPRGLSATAPCSPLCSPTQHTACVHLS